MSKQQAIRIKNAFAESDEFSEKLHKAVRGIPETGIDQLKEIISRIERMEDEKHAISSDIKEIYAEVKRRGYDTKVIRQIIKIKKQPIAERHEQAMVLEAYMLALGMLSDTELGKAAIYLFKNAKQKNDEMPERP